MWVLQATVTRIRKRRYAASMSRIDDTAAFTELSHRLVEVRQQHRDLDLAIEGLQAIKADQLSVQRLKKRKLQLKDEITRLEQALVPDEPA